MDPLIEKVKSALSQLGVEPKVVVFGQTTKTAQEAADQLGVALGQIVKSLLFIADEEPVLVLTAGPNRADAKLLREILGKKKVRLADPETVFKVTGYPVGGVPPVGHPRPLRVLMDEDLFNVGADPSVCPSDKGTHTGVPLLYCGAGTDNAMLEIEAEKLKEITQAEVVRVG
jgi:prolyl-tRNA editing enzyme YbaK/EbsC (Cys-tRNA(Pro) deacylase)